MNSYDEFTIYSCNIYYGTTPDRRGAGATDSIRTSISVFPYERFLFVRRKRRREEKEIACKEPQRQYQKNEEEGDKEEGDEKEEKKKKKKRKKRNRL